MTFETIRKKYYDFCISEDVDPDIIKSIFQDLELGRKLHDWSDRYDLNPDHVILVLNDQKVIPMIRGKASEYVVFDRLSSLLDNKIWKVIKPDINPQPNLPDQDVIVQHIETERQFIVEVKNSQRGSVKVERRTKMLKLNIKCHKSRSNLTRIETNDRYLPDDFDFVFSSLSNALLKNGEYQIIDNPTIINMLCKYYKVSNMDEVMLAATEDIRFVQSTDILHSDGISINRTPKIYLNEEENNWKSINEFPDVLNSIME